ncbi:MAG TPA: LysR family transcriptional regulator [Advenella sp.]|nr:LysR family transcriptional regulator [Advenella sp.]
MNITFKQIEAFLAVARTLSFSQAAAAVHLSQPALSANIHRLEQTLGARLFDRDTRTVSLSVVGREFVDVACGIANQVACGLDHMQEVVSGSHGRLTIAVAPSVAAGVLPNVLLRYKAAYPGIHVKIHDVLTSTGIEMVRTGGADMALLPEQPDAEDLEQHVLFKDPLVVLCATDHPLASRQDLDWPDIISQDLIVRGQDSSVRQLLDAQFLQRGQILQPAFEVNQVSTALGLISAGLGIGVVPASLLSTININGVHCGRFRAASTTYWTLCASTLSARSPSPTVEPFIRLCLAYLKSSRGRA